MITNVYKVYKNNLTKYLEVRDGSHKEIRRGLKIGIKDGNKLIVSNIIAIHGGLEITSLVTISNHSMPVHNAGTLTLPFVDLLFDQHLRRRIIGIVQNLNQQLRFWPLQIAHSRNRLLVNLNFVPPKNPKIKPTLLKREQNTKARNFVRIVTSFSLHMGI